MTRAQEQKKIEDIIRAFKTYGIGDIKYNRRRTISAFILSICFLDQLASFRYPKSETYLSIRVEKFIDEYLPLYSRLGLYAIFRHAIIHHYSSVRRYALTNDKDFKKPFEKIKGVTVINTNALVKEIIKGFSKFEADLLSVDSEVRKNALSRAKKHPPLTHKGI